MTWQATHVAYSTRAIPAISLSNERWCLLCGQGSSYPSGGSTAFVDLTEDGELLPYEALIDSATYYRFPIVDLSVPQSPAEMVRMKWLQVVRQF